MVKAIYQIIVDYFQHCPAFLLLGKKLSQEEIKGFGLLAEQVIDEKSYEQFLEAYRLYDKFNTDVNKVDLALDGHEDSLEA